MFEMIADLPLAERPRERMKKHGIRTLSDSELVAILLGSGTQGKNAINLAREILASGLIDLASTEPEQLVKTTGVGPAKAARIAAAFEIGRRFAAGEPEERPAYEADALARRLMIRFAPFRQEHLGALFLDSRDRIVREKEIFIGGINQACVSTRDVLKMALDADAVGVVLYHNHPSGDPAPSNEDIAFTAKMSKALDYAMLKLVDHLIVGKHRYLSMKAKGSF